MKSSRFKRVTADTLVYEKGCLLQALTLLVSTTGGDIAVYDGQDANSGRLIGTFKATANVSNCITFGGGIRCERGLFVDVGSNVSEALLCFDPFEAAEEGID